MRTSARHEGVAKSHLAIAIARSFIRNGARRPLLQCRRVNRLEIESRSGRQGRIAEHLIRLDFVVLDELGYLPFLQPACSCSSILFRSSPSVITTNLAFGEWPSVFGNAKMTTALLRPSH